MNMHESASIDLAPALIVEDVQATGIQLGRLLREICGEDSDIAIVDTLADARASQTTRPRPFALVDIGLPDGNGIELIAWLHAHHPQTASVVVSAWGDERTVLAALRAGAQGYLFKERDPDELRAALLSVQRGGAPIDPFVARGILDFLVRERPASSASAAAGAACPPLTIRETEVLKLVEHGCSNREIAELMGLSRFTVEGYVKAVYRKLAVTSRTAAVFEAKARGLLR